MTEMNPSRVVLCGLVPNRLTTLVLLPTLFMLGCNDVPQPGPVEGAGGTGGTGGDESGSDGPGATSAGSGGGGSTGQAASSSSSGSSGSSDSSDSSSSGCDPTPVFDIVTGYCTVCDKIVKAALVCEQECVPGLPCWCEDICGPCFEGCEADAAGCWCDGEIAPAEYCEEIECWCDGDCAFNPLLPACVCDGMLAPDACCE